MTGRSGGGGFFHFMEIGQFVLEMRIAIRRHSTRRWRHNGVRFDSGGSSSRFRRLESGQSVLEGGREFTRSTIGGRDAGLIHVRRRGGGEMVPFENGASLHHDQIGGGGGVICNRPEKGQYLLPG